MHHSDTEPLHVKRWLAPILIALGLARRRQKKAPPGEKGAG